MKQIQTGEIAGFCAGAIIAIAGIIYSTPLAAICGALVCGAVVIEYSIKGE